MLFDTHAHYDDEKFDLDRDETIKRAHENGVAYIINAGSDLKSSKRSVELAAMYDFVYAAVGIHPQEADIADEQALELLRKLCGSPKVVAIGEIGLDYYYDTVPKEVQKKIFIRQIHLARELGLPIVVHDRDAHEDSLNIVKGEKAGEVGGVFHCYSGSTEMARKLLNNNFYLSFGGVVTFKNARKVVEAVRYVPLDRLLIETDSPYLSPEPFRGKRNESAYVRYVAEKIAEIKGISYEEVASVTLNNAKRLFNIK